MDGTALFNKKYDIPLRTAGIMDKKSSEQLPESVVSTRQTTRWVSAAVAKGRLCKIGPRLYTSNPEARFSDRHSARYQGCPDDLAGDCGASAGPAL
jgi:hypothetical protein